MSNDDNRPVSETQKINWFDGMTPSNADFNDQQSGLAARSSNMAKDFQGSGVLNRTPLNLLPLLNTAAPAKTNISYSALTAGNYDGLGIFVDRQPLDSVYGNQLLLTLTGANISTSLQAKVYIFGKVYNADNSLGTPTLEAITFGANGIAVSTNYFISVIGVFFNNLSGGIGRTELVSTATTSVNVSGAGQVATINITEVDPLRVIDASIVAAQIIQPNLFMRDFITSSIARRFVDELTVLINTAQNRNYVNTSLLDLNALPLSANGLANKPFLNSTNVGAAYGQKVFLTTNNVQQVSLALSLSSGTTFTGEIVIGIRELQTTSINQFANQIDLDPEPNILFEASFTATDLLNVGYVLNNTPQEVKFNFISAPVSIPASLLKSNTYYIFTITRRGDVSQGTIAIEVGTHTAVNSQFTTFNAITKTWTNDSNTDMWFKVYSAAVRVSSGVAYTNDGTMVSIQKTALNDSGVLVSYISGPYSLAIVNANASDNIIVLTEAEEFAGAITPNPRTGNPIYSRIYDQAQITIYNSSDFATLVASSPLPPLILGKINDFNNKLDNVFTGSLYLPGQVQTDSVVLINSVLPTNTLLNNKVFIPDVSSPSIKYKITNSLAETRLLGDFDGSGLFTYNDILKEEEVADVFSSQGSTILTPSLPYPISDTRARDELAYGEETLEDFLIADLDSNLIINSDDEARLTYLVNTLPASITPPATKINLMALQLGNVVNTSSPINITQTSTNDGYVVDPQTIYFNAPFIQDLRAMNVGDLVSLSTVADFSAISYSNLVIKQFLQKNDMIIETRFNRAVPVIVGTPYILSFFGYDPDPITAGGLTKQAAGNPAAIGDGYLVSSPTPHLVGTSEFNLNFPPNTYITSAPFSNVAAGISGNIIIHWTSNGAGKSMIFSNNPVSISGDGNPDTSIINRINGTLFLDAGDDIPDQGTAITADYSIAPVSTLKKCYPTQVVSVSGLTNIEFRVPYATYSSNANDPAFDSYGVDPSAYSSTNLPFILIQSDQAVPPTIINTDTFGIIPGKVLSNNAPSLQVKAVVSDNTGNVPNLTGGNYYFKVISGTNINLPATQKQFVNNSFGVSYNSGTQVVSITAPITWQVEQVNFEWLPANMVVSDLRRYVSVALTQFDNTSTYTTSNKLLIPSDMFIKGELLSDVNVPYHGDIEVAKIVLNLPLTSILSNSINIYNDLVASYSLSPGITRAGYPAMKFSDGTYVGADDNILNTTLTKNQIRIMPSIGSLNIDTTQVPNATSYTDLDEILTKLHYELRAGMYFDDGYGILYFHMEGIKDIFANEAIVQTGTVKVIIDVSLKKSGFVNTILTLGEADVSRLLLTPGGIVCPIEYSLAGDIEAGFVAGSTIPSSC